MKKNEGAANKGEMKKLQGGKGVGRRVKDEGMRDCNNNTTNMGESWKKRKKKTQNAKEQHWERGAAADAQMRERIKQRGGERERGRDAEGGRERKGLYQGFKRSSQTASWWTAGSEQGAAKADKRLIQAWRTPLITHTCTHTNRSCKSTAISLYKPHSHTEPNTHT